MKKIEIVKRVAERLKKIADKFSDFGSGVGVVIVKDRKFLEKTIPLRPSFEKFKLEEIGIKRKSVEEILTSLAHDKVFHDGFHVVDLNLEIIGLSRYLLPRKTEGLLPNEFHGARYMTAKLISKDKDVIGSIIISSKGDAFYFVDGVTYVVEQQWDRIYRKKEEYKYYDLMKPHEYMEDFSKMLKEEGAKRILDLGCGIGRNLIFLAKKGFEVYGIDLSENAIDFLREVIKKEKLNAKVKVWNVYDPLPYKDDFFDAVISVQVLQHGTEAQIKQALKEVKRVLKKGGYFFVTLAGRISKGKVRYCLVKTAEKIAPHTYIPKCGKEAGLVHFIFNKRLIKKFFEEAGFEIIDIWRDEKDYYCVLARG